MKKILLIEDNQAIRENTAEILELANYEVFTAENGKAGIETALKVVPDLIICDIMMPVLDGYGVLHLIHKNTGLQNIPFIFLSAKSERLDIRKGMEMGADDYIPKPFDETELLNAVESRLKKIDLLKQECMSGIDEINKLIQLTNGKTALQSLIEDRTVNRYRKKQIVYQEGNRPSRLYFIQKGKVKTYKTNEDGKDLVIGLYNEGDYLGYVALLEGSSYNETAETIEETELVIVPREDFEKLINTSHEVMRKFITLLAHNVAEKEEKLLGLAYNSLRKKVAEALLALHKKYKAPIDISRENLATIAGTATESLIRTLSDFKSEGLVEIKGGLITILNEKKISTMFN
jgi:CRP/FNR family transcriptional regulator, cyclic AMP receptor protein